MRTSRPVKKTFPINVMPEGRRVVVVGGGKVGERKVELLLESGAEIVLVAPKCTDALAKLAGEGGIEWLARDFIPEDLNGAFLCFACTDDRFANKQILKAAQKAKVLCCCADGNWCDGDFTTPAIIRADDVTIAVSTGGKSARLAKLVKENLKRHIESVEGSDLLVLGTNHECLPENLRAPLHLQAEERKSVGAMIKQVWGVQEFLLLNTCNRIELVAAISDAAGASAILRSLMRFDGLPAGGYYIKHGYDAFAHFCSVAAGMDSQTPGEFHVVSQIKDALTEALQEGWAGPIVSDLADGAMHVSKDIRHAIGPLLDVAEIEDVALRFLDHACGMLAGRKRALVVGTGVLGKALLAGLRERGYQCTWAWHRNKPEAPADVHLVQMDDCGEVLPDVDLVASAVNSREPILDASRYAQKLNPAGMLFIDLGMPRNISPDLARPNVRIADLDVLKHWQRTMNGSLVKALAISRNVLEEHREIYDRIRASLRGKNSGDKPAPSK